MIPFLDDASWFKQCLTDQKLVKKLQNITLIISDVDSCLTNGHVYVALQGEEQKAFCIQDGFGITKAIKAGLPIAFLSGRHDKITPLRARHLGIPDELCLIGKDGGKRDGVHEIQNKVKATKEQTAFFGDDFLDIEVKDEASLFIAPINAVFYVQEHADLVIPRLGGNGAFRLFLDLVLYVQQKHVAQKFIDDVVKQK